MIRTGIKKFGDFVNSNTKNNETYIFEVLHDSDKAEYYFMSTKCEVLDKGTNNPYGLLFQTTFFDMMKNYKINLKEGRYSKKTMESLKNDLNKYINWFSDYKPELELVDELY